MSRNEKMEVKSCGEEQSREKQTKVNKKRKNDNKLTEKGERGAEDISKKFPNFSVLTDEERLAFFQALTTARREIENKGVLTRKCFGTVHDEYLKYFDQNDQGEEDKQADNRSIRSSFTLCNSGVNACSNQFEVTVDQEYDRGHPEEEKCSSSILYFRDFKESPRKSSPTVTLKTRNWEQYESIIQAEANKVVDLFLKKKKRKAEKADHFQSDKAVFENDGPEKKNWIALRFSRELDTPRFDALNPEEKEVFFKILQEAYDNVLQQNPNEDFQIFPLDAILKRYQGGNEVATVFATTKDICRRGEPKKHLKVSVTVASRGNERLVQQTDASIMEKSKKTNIKSQYPLEVEDCSRSQVQKAGNARLEASFADFKTPEAGVPTKKPCKDSLKASKTFPTSKQTKFCENETANNEKNQLKKEEKEDESECREHAQEVSSPQKESTAREGSGFHLLEKNSGKAEELDCRSLLSATKKTFAENAKWESSSNAKNSRNVYKETEPEDKCNGSLVAVTQQEPAKNEMKAEIAMPITREKKLSKKVSFVCENSEKVSSELLNEGGENERNEPEDKQISMGEVLQKKSSVEDAPDSWDKVMLVNGDVVGKIKRLIYYLEAKVNKDSHLEKEYLRLLVDYADYLSKVLEFLILKKAKQKNQQRNALETSEFWRFCDDHRRMSEDKSESAEREFLLRSASEPDNRKKHLTFVLTEETVQETLKEQNMELDSNLPVLSDSESIGSEGETRFKHRKDGRERILPTKIRLLQDVLRQRAEFVEGNFDDFKIIQYPEEKFVPEEKPPTVKLLTEGETNGQKNKRNKFLKPLLRFLMCGKKIREATEEGIMENLKGEAFRVDESRDKKDAASAVLSQATLEVLKAVERKKIIDKYFTNS